MKRTRVFALLTLLIGMNIFASNLNNIDKIVEAINITKDVELKIVLVEELDKQLQGMNKKEFYEALNLINKKLILLETEEEKNNI